MESDAENIEPERDIKLLLEKHGALLAEVKGALAKELDPAIHDDIFLLRYVLSYKTLDKVELVCPCPQLLSCAPLATTTAPGGILAAASFLPRQHAFFSGPVRCEFAAS
jgi:hypothetical protein